MLSNTFSDPTSPIDTTAAAQVHQLIRHSTTLECLLAECETYTRAGHIERCAKIRAEIALTLASIRKLAAEIKV